MRKHAMNTANQADDGPAQDFSKKNTKSTKKKKLQLHHDQMAQTLDKICVGSR